MVTVRQPIGDRGRLTGSVPILLCLLHYALCLDVQRQPLSEHFFALDRSEVSLLGEGEWLEFSHRAEPCHEFSLVLRLAIQHEFLAGALEWGHEKHHACT